MSKKSDIITNPSQEHTVVLPCEPEQFREFISGLLGKPQTIKRRIYEPFDVTRKDVENIYHLIEQRIHSQNEATLIQFTARIVYDDNSSVLLNSYEDFKGYNEVKPLISIAAHLSWTYLITFRNKSIPERQQIDIGFSVPSIRNSTFEQIDSFDEIYRRFSSQISFRVSHTDRTWGTDIESLLDGHLRKFVRNETGLRAVVLKNSGWVGLVVGSLIFASVLAITFKVTNKFVEKYLELANQFVGTQNADFELVTRKLDFIVQVIASGMWTRYAFYVTGYFISSAIVSIIIGVIVSTYAGKKRPSFVLLTERSKEHYRTGMAKHKNNWVIFIMSMTGALALAVMGNYIFYKMSQYWSL